MVDEKCWKNVPKTGGILKNMVEKKPDFKNMTSFLASEFSWEKDPRNPLIFFANPLLYRQKHGTHFGSITIKHNKKLGTCILDI